jgi:hypothetical protein
MAGPVAVMPAIRGRDAERSADGWVVCPFGVGAAAGSALGGAATRPCRTARGRRLLASVAAAAMLAACGGSSAPQPTSTSTSTSTSTTVVNPVDRSSAVWPSERSATRPVDAVAAARAFATEVLHFRAPVVGELRQGDTRSGEIDLRPRPDGPVTTVFVRQLSGEDTWSVLGATTADIQIDAPSAGQAVGDPVVVRGRAVAFEGTVEVAVLADDVPEPIGTGLVTGGGDQLRPFQGAIDRVSTDVARGALVLFTVSMEDGAVWSASVVRIAFAGDELSVCQPPLVPDVRPDQMLVTVYFTCRDTDELVAVDRAVPRSTGVLRASLDALVVGPGDSGLLSWFSPDTASIVRSVDLAAGHAVVDFVDLRPVIPNASTSGGSALLLSQLDATVFVIPSIDTVEYRMEGSCQDFGEWVQTGCTVRNR